MKEITFVIVTVTIVLAVLWAIFGGILLGAGLVAMFVVALFLLAFWGGAKWKGDAMREGAEMVQHGFNRATQIASGADRRNIEALKLLREYKRLEREEAKNLPEKDEGLLEAGWMPALPGSNGQTTDAEFASWTGFEDDDNDKDIAQ